MKFKLLKILKLIRLTRLTRIISNMKVTKETKGRLKLLKLIFFLFMYIHCQCCLFFYVISADELWQPPWFRIWGLKAHLFW